MSTTLIMLDTRDSVNPDEPHNAHFNLNLKMNELTNTHMGLSQVQFSNTVYPINSNYNTLIYQENSGASTITLTIVPNNYTGSQLATYLSINMSAATLNGITYTVTYDSQSKKLVFSLSVLNFRILPTSTCLLELGISKLGMTIAATSKIGDFPVELSGSKFIDVISNISCRHISSSDYSNILVRIPLNVGFGEVVIYEPTNPILFNIFQDNLSRVELRLIDDRRNLFVLPANSSVGYQFITQYLGAS